MPPFWTQTQSRSGRAPLPFVHSTSTHLSLSEENGLPATRAQSLSGVESVEFTLRREGAPIFIDEFERIALDSLRGQFNVPGRAQAELQVTVNDNLATRLGASIEKCWIASKDPAFASYIYSPEPNATGGPRILLVPRKTPTGAPALVVQVVENGNHVSVFGALATSPEAGRIGTDLRRWISGGEGCS